ncbi:leucyl aminopeptidase [Haloimpatiens sp. FM7330]|uniref:M17 family metallopeptidase n=1 Tax=Haloimpatiens sp. FM7330 TaxID=3298610 RepID=UPI0036365521
MIKVSNNNLYSNLLVFKFENYNFSYPESINKFLSFSTNSGKFKEFECINTLNQSSYKKIYVIGLGLTEEFNPTILFKALGHVMKKLRNCIDDLDILDTFNSDFGYTFGESLTLSLYKFKGIKKHFLNIKLTKINIISTFNNSINKGIISGESINFARELVNSPSNHVTPKYLTQQALHIAEECNLDIKIFDKYMLEKLGMNSIVQVGNGSSNEPYLILLQYFGDPSSKKIVSLVGKGVTFDSGGISLKSSKGMHNMVSDMAGGAAVLGVMKAIGTLKPKKNILALIPVCENIPSSKSYKPGDVITSYSGKTIQIISTDAEGRLIMCDAIAYAKELGATTIIDVATLTGSCANFLGNINIGLFSNSNKLSNKIIDCGKEVGEKFWRLPNNEEYMEQLKTPSADLKNTGNNCGAIVAGMFLQSFAPNIDFAHLDIAGCAKCSKHEDVYEAGANGKPARTLINLIMH